MSIADKTDRPWHHVGQRVMHNPFDFVGERYCMRCQEYGSAAKEARFENQVYAVKEWCKKCGHIITYAIWGDRGSPKTVTRATAWATSREIVTG